MKGCKGLTYLSLEFQKQKRERYYREFIWELLRIHEWHQYIPENLWILSRTLKKKNHILTHYSKIIEHQREKEYLKNNQWEK